MSHNSKTGRCCTLLLWLLLLGALFFLVCGMFLLMGKFFGIGDPLTFQVDSVDIIFPHPNNSSDTVFNLNLTVTVNTNEVRVADTLHVDTEYGPHLLATSILEDFRPKNHSQYTTYLLMPVSLKLVDNLATESKLDFTVIFGAPYWIYYGPELLVKCYMKAVCKDVTVILSSTKNNTWKGTTKDGPFSCKFSTTYCEDASGY